MNPHSPANGAPIDPYDNPERRRVPTLPIGHKGDQDRGPYHTEQGVGAWFVIDSCGDQVAHFDTADLAHATADMFNGFEPDAPTVEVSK